MTEDRLPLAELLQKAGDTDFLRAVAEAVVQLLMESDVEGLIGAARQCRLDRVEPAVEQSNTRFGLGLHGIRLRGRAGHGVVSCPARQHRARSGWATRRLRHPQFQPTSRRHQGCYAGAMSRELRTYTFTVVVEPS